MILLKVAECNKALISLFPRVNMRKVAAFIDSITMISPTRKCFYKRILQTRYEIMLKGPYEQLIARQ